MLLNLKLDYCASFEEPEINLFQEGEAFVLGYDIKGLHSAIKDIVQLKILKLAQRGTKINCIAIESVCKYDEEFFVPSIGLKKKFKKNNSVFYCDKYSPKNCQQKDPETNLGRAPRREFSADFSCFCT